MDLDKALEYFLEVRTSDKRADLIAAAKEAARRRKEGPVHTAAVIRAMRDELGMTYREIEAASCNEWRIPGGTASARISKSTAEHLLRDKP